MAGTEQRPRTWWSDRDADDEAYDRDELWTKTAVFVAVLVAAPLAVLTAAVLSAATILARLRWWWPLAVGAGATVWLLAGVGLDAAASTYWATYVDVGRVVARRSDPRWAAWLAAQLPLALPVGALAAGAVTAWAELRRPSWRQRPRRQGLSTLARRAAVAWLIRTGRLGVRNGVALGHDPRGRVVRLSHDETKGGVLVLGAPDTGKSVTSLQPLQDAIPAAIPVVVVDLKGSPRIAATLQAWARQHGRPCWLFSFGGPCVYDPLARGDASRRKDLLIGAGQWTEPHYKQVASDYAQTVFQVMDATAPAAPAGRAVLDELVELLDPEQLAGRAARLHDLELAEAARSWTRRLTQDERSAIGGLRHRVSNLARSTAGAWLRARAGAPAIDLATVVAEGGVVCFSLDALNYEEVAASLGGLIIQDCKTLAGDLIAGGNDQPIYVWVDEFSALQSDNVLGLLNKCREAEVRVMLTTQSLADLLRHHEAFLRQVIDLTNCKLIHRTNDPDSAELLSALAGTVRGYDERMEVEQHTGIPGTFGTGSATGRSMVSEVDKRRVSPGVIMELQQGHCTLVVKAPRLRVVEDVRVVCSRGTLTAARPADASLGPAAGAQPAPPAGLDVPPRGRPVAAAWRLAVPGEDEEQPAPDPDGEPPLEPAPGEPIAAGPRTYNPSEWKDDT